MTSKPKYIRLGDLSVDPNASMYEKTATVNVVFAEQAAEMNTLEGLVPYSAGDALLEGVMGEKWPVKRNVFDSQYEHVSGDELGIYRKKREAYVYAKQMTADFQVDIRDGNASLVGKPGDWLVQYSSGEFGVIANTIFIQSYREIAQ